MKTFTIYWEGTVVGTTQVEAENIDDAIDIARNSDNSIDIEIYPDNWHIDTSTTEEIAENTK